MGRPVQEFTQTFERGLRTVDSPLARRSLETMDNVRLSRADIGAIKAFAGFSKVNSSEITGATFHSTGSARAADGTRLRLVSYIDGSNNEFIVDVNPTTGAQTTIASHATSPAITVPDFSVVTMNDLALFSNGTDAAFKYNFSALSAWGVDRPDVTNASVAVNGGGNIIGIVSYYIAQVTGTTEGALSEDIGPIDAGTGSTIDVDLSHADFSGKTYRVYRTLADGTVPFLVAQVSGGATFSDNVPPAQLTNPPYLHGDPPLATIVSLINFSQRVFGWTNDSILVWSDPKEPESFWNVLGGQYAPVGEDDGDEGVALAFDTSGLFAFKKDHIYRLVGAEDPDTMDVNQFEPVTQRGRNLGTASENSLISAHGAIAFYWNKGVYLLRNGAVDYISRDIEDDLSVIRGQDEEDGVYLGFFPKDRELYVSVPLSAGTTPTHTYVYDLDGGQWVGRRTVGFRGFLSTFDANGDEVFWALGASDGFIYKMSDGQTAAGTAISTEAKLPVFMGRNPSTRIELKYVKLEIQPRGSGTIDVDIYEGANSTAQSYTSISQVKAGFDRWVLTVNTPDVGIARYFQVGVKSNADQPPWILHSATYGYQEHVGASR